ncbi:MAG: site-2 protease family protein [Clostridia bacterium]|nr:site-2 protease family protein [Clostridia bacterium]
MTDLIISRLLAIPGMILFFSFRGFFQAWVAKKLGDHLPEQDGFLTMNPKAHINIFGFIMLLLVGIGFGKPMRFDSRFYKHPKRDAAIQILSGPAAGIIAAFGMYTLFFVSNDLIGYFTGLNAGKVYPYISLIFWYGAQIAVFLTVFHLLPLPGFDTYRLIVNFLPYNVYRKFYTIEKYSLWIYIGFILLLRVPVIGDFLYNYLIIYPANAILWLIERPFVLLSNLIH